MLNEKIKIEDKKCSCGEIHKEIPTTAKVNEMGYWWDCSCGSTLLKTTTQWKNKLAEKRLENKR